MVWHCCLGREELSLAVQESDREERAGEKSAVSVVLRSDCSMDCLSNEWVASG